MIISNFKYFIIPPNYDGKYLVGFKLDPDRENCDFFTVVFCGDIDQPLTIDDYIIFFNDISILSKTLEFVAPEILQDLDISDFAIIDIAEMLYLIEREKIDNSAIILNGLNMIFDLVKASRLKMPDECKRILYRFADYCTFNQEISVFFENENISRKQIINNILWCIGAIVSKSKILTTLPN